MANKLQAGLDSEQFDFFLEELQDAARSGDPLIFHHEELARRFSSALCEVYPDHLFLCCKGFQAICINRESVDTLIERLQKNFSILLTQLNEIDTLLDFLFRRASSLPTVEVLKNTDVENTSI